MPSELQQNRYDQLLRRVGGIVGPGSKVSEVLTELFPTLDVENVPGELLALQGTKLGFGGAGVGAVVAEHPKIQLFNPAGSGKLVTITRVDVSAEAGTFCRYTIEAAPRGAPVLSETFRDTRLGVGPNTAAQILFVSDAVLTENTGRLRLQQNVNIVLEDPNGVFILAPGTGVTFVIEILNTGMTVSFMWRERPAELSELNF